MQRFWLTPKMPKRRGRDRPMPTKTRPRTWTNLGLLVPQQERNAAGQQRLTPGARVTHNIGSCMHDRLTVFAGPASVHLGQQVRQLASAIARESEQAMP